MDRRSLKARQGSKYAAKPSKEMWRKGDLNAVCDRQQTRADPLLFTKRPATIGCIGLYHIDISDNQLIPSCSSTRGNNQKYLVPSTRTTLLKDSYFPDTIRLWNMIPQQVVGSPSIDVFKTLVCDVNLC